MKGQKAFHKSRKLYIISGTILVLIVAGLIFWRNYKYKLVNKKLDNLVTGKSRGLYQISYKNLFIDEAGGNISVENVEVMADSLVYHSMEEQNSTPQNIFHIQVPKLHITGVKTPKALLNKEISAHIIRIENASIEIIMAKGKKENESGLDKLMDPGLYRQLLGRLNSIAADSVVLENSTLTLVDKDSKRIRCKTAGLSLRFAFVAIDSVHQKDSSRILFSKELAIHCNQLDLPFRNKIYTLSVSGFDYSSQTATMHTEHIAIIPALSESDFAKAHKFAKDRFDIRIGSLDVKNIDRRGILNQQFLADTIQLNDASFRIFRDKSYPHDSVDRTHDYPQEAIMRLDLPIFVKNILFNRSYIEYKEKNEKSDSSGKVSFYHVQAALTNVTNMPEYIRRNNIMRLDFKSSFLNQTGFSAVIRMKLNDRKGDFQLDAQLGEMNAVMLNPLVKPVALAEMDKGKINGLRYHLDATNTHAKGRLMLRYEDLSVKLLKIDEDKNKYKRKFFPTLAAGVLIKKSNPMNGELRSGNVDYARDIHRSIFHLMWKSMFTGIKKIVI
jgi:hypothetical protein